MSSALTADGRIVANGDTVVLAVAGYAGAALQIADTFTGTVSFTGTLDGQNYVPILGTPVGGAAAASSATAPGLWGFGMAGLLAMRVVGSGWSAGAARITLRATDAAGATGSGGGSVSAVAPTRVQSTGRVRGASVTSIALTFASAPVAGNTVVAAAILYNTNGTNFTCADNKGNTYTKVVAATNGGVHTVIFACNVPLVTGGTFTVTLTAVSGPGYFEGTALEVTGAGGTGVLTVDQTMTQTATGATPNTGTTAALTGSDVFMVAGHAIQADQTSITVQSVSPSWVEELENRTYSTSIAGEIDSRSVTGVGGSTQSGSWTDSTSANYAAAIVVFKGV